ncbi:hypothetical protein GCM10009827_118070 [Dactylosporangium maewongense]|uniref:Uncharacterized protein n=1 Tax=Dactylosporangium maewongense TaxID=634393 RepID=A0ABN2DIG0_9ACTN
MWAIQSTRSHWTTARVVTGSDGTGTEVPAAQIVLGSWEQRGAGVTSAPPLFPDITGVTI